MSAIDFTPGSLVGRYEIVRKIGTGGMAEVYLAHLRGGAPEALVAIKRLLPSFAHEPRFIEMFVAEARLAATLHHQNIARVVAPGTTDARDLPADAVATLIGRAMRTHARGDLDEAVIALEIALSAARPEGGIDALLASSESLILGAFTAFIGDQSRMVALSGHLEQLVGIPIDQRAAFLLTRIDGTLTAKELLATCGLPKREAYRHLCQLLLRELVVLA